MQQNDAPSSQPLDYGTVRAGQSNDSAAVPATLFWTGVGAAAYISVLLWLPSVESKIPGFVEACSWPLVFLVTLVFGLASLIGARHSPRHWS